MEVRDVVAHEGDLTRDPRLQDIDLRGRVRAVTLTILMPDGAPAGRGRVIVRGRTAEPDLVEGHLLKGRPVTLTTSAPSVDARILVPGCLEEEVRGVAEDHVVRLREGLPVRVRLAGDVPLPPGRVSVRIGITAERPSLSGGSRPWIARIFDRDVVEETISGGGDGSYRPDVTVTRTLRPGGEAVFPLPGAGLCTLPVWANAGDAEIRISGALPSRIVVPEGGGGPPVPVTWTQADLDAAQRALGL